MAGGVVWPHTACRADASTSSLMPNVDRPGREIILRERRPAVVEEQGTHGRRASAALNSADVTRAFFSRSSNSWTFPLPVPGSTDTNSMALGDLKWAM